MPDQHTAAAEHALMSKIAEPLDRLPDDPLAAIMVDFPVALRGYDRLAVDAYVERTAQLVAELQSSRSPEAAVRRALQRFGEEISGILQQAHDTADEITSRSRAEAEERLAASRREAIEITAEAEQRVKDLDAETERIWAERHSIVTDARELARRLTELAEAALERFPADPAAPAAGAGSREPLREPSAAAVDDEAEAFADDPAPAPQLFDGASEVDPAMDEPEAFEPPEYEPEPAPDLPGEATEELPTDEQPRIERPPQAPGPMASAPPPQWTPMYQPWEPRSTR
jgi:hypothetical protein